MAALDSGDLAQLGRLMDEAQGHFDRHATPVCPAQVRWVKARFRSLVRSLVRVGGEHSGRPSTDQRPTPPPPTTTLCTAQLPAPNLHSLPILYTYPLPTVPPPSPTTPPHSLTLSSLPLPPPSPHPPPTLPHPAPPPPSPYPLPPSPLSSPRPTSIACSPTPRFGATSSAPRESAAKVMAVRSCSASPPRIWLRCVAFYSVSIPSTVLY